MKKLKKALKRIPGVGYLAKSLHNVLFPKIHIPAYWIDRYVKNSSCDIVQIGSNDGRTGDPIYSLIIAKTKWKTVLVEPVPYLFERLKKNYPAEPRFRFENAAINDGIKQVFYFVNIKEDGKLKNFPNWHDQLGSFNRANITNHLDGTLEPFIEEMEVDGLTLDDLFKKNGVENLKLLHLDTEGYDWKILSQLDLKKLQPAVLFFEHKHLSEAELAEASNFLEPEFHVFKFESDFLCLRKEILKKSDLRKLNELMKSAESI
ncbi:MAG: FkbM family methyltransferase [Algoriphagus sp.]|nr:FkbM family methyltransferase [Algoriphagus sp.]